MVNSWKKLEDRLKEISELKENWDDDGAKIIGKAVIDKARNFFLCWCNASVGQDSLQYPEVSPLCTGGIDLHWKSENFELLVTASPESETLEFYGDRHGIHHVKGVLTPFMDLRWLITWVLHAPERKK